MRSCCAAALVLLVLGSASFAGMVKVDDFESYTVDQDVDDQVGWGGAGGKAGVIDVEAKAGNQFLGVNKVVPWEDGAVFTTGGRINIPAGATAATLFFRLGEIYNAGNGNDDTEIWIGLAESATGVEADLNAKVGVLVKGQETFYVAEGASEVSKGFSIADDDFMNVWMVVNNQANTFSVYVTQGTDSATAADAVATDVAFTNDSTGALADFQVFVDAWRPSAAWIGVDDLYVDAGTANLANPVPEPATLALLAVGAAVLIRRR